VNIARERAAGSAIDANALGASSAPLFAGGGIGDVVVGAGARPLHPATASATSRRRRSIKAA
jgi:hypothetical protein